MEKSIAIVCGDQIEDLVIRPGTTAGEVIQSAGLPKGHALSRKDGLFFAETEEIYGIVEDGGKLFASPPAVVGSQEQGIRWAS